MQQAGGRKGSRVGPFRLLKYFIISGFVIITAETLLLGGLFYTRSVDTLLKSTENHARRLAENLNYNIYHGFYAPLKTRGIPVDLRNWDQFEALDSLIKDFTHGLKLEIKIIDRDRKIIYSTEYDAIGTRESRESPFDKAAEGRDVTLIRWEDGKTPDLSGKWLADVYHPLSEVTGNLWMEGKTYGVMQITQDVTAQYKAVRRSITAIILVTAGLMVILFIMLSLVVRRGENILLERSREQQRLEEQLQQSEKLASIGQMVATIAHEIRNPLGIIRSSAEMLARKKNPEPTKIRKLSEIIEEEATRLSAILTDFLEFAKPRSPNRSAVDVREIISRVRENLDSEIESRSLTWAVETENGTVPTVWADGELIYQAFLNVVMNAFEAMDPGGNLVIRIKTIDDLVRMEFVDDGKGISEENIQKIFTPFFTTHEMGTGLGLSVVHNIITAHGGELTVRSEVNRGTVFTVVLPGPKAGQSLQDQLRLEAL